MDKIEFSQSVTELNRREIANGLTYHKVDYETIVAHIVRVNLRSGNWKIVPMVAADRKKTSRFAVDSDCFAAINAGYFNMTDGLSASYIANNGRQLCDPKLNKALVENKSLKPFLPSIFNRSELRIYKDESGQLIPKIMPHNAEFKTTMKLVSSMQAGPQLLPNISAEQGAFVRVLANGKKVDSIGTTRKAARSAIGITKYGAILLVCVEGARNKEFSTGASLKLMANLLKEVGCISALNLDGGTSTSLVVKGDPKSFSSKNTNLKLAPQGYTVLFSNQPERCVKSVLCVQPRN